MRRDSDTIRSVQSGSQGPQHFLYGGTSQKFRALVVLWLTLMREGIEAGEVK